MIKFLDRFGLDKTDIRQVFPDYIKLFEDVSRLQFKIKEGVSTQAENEYISILESMDDFLMREENIQKFRNVLGLPMRLDKGGTDFTQEEAVEYLEDEIFELEKSIPADILNSKKEKESIYKNQQKVSVDLSKRIERYDDRGGIKFKYIQFKMEQFNRCLSIMKSGCKFLYRSFGDINYILFPLNEDVKLIVETSTPIKDYKSIFGGSSDVMAYILCKDKKDIDKYYELLRYAFDEVESEPFINIDDDSLFNNPPLIGAFIDGYLYQNADELIQGDSIQNSIKIENLFSLSLPLQKLLTLVLCSKMYSNRSFLGAATKSPTSYEILTDEEMKNKIDDVVNTHSYRLEGVGGVPHRSEVLDDLIESKLLTDFYKPTSKGFDLIYLNNKNLNPDLRANQYYIADIESEFKKSKNKFSSMFGMDILYHTKESFNNIEIALILSPKQLKNWGFEKSKQINAFSQEYQSITKTYDYQEFVPFGCESDLDINTSNTSREINKKTDSNTIYFQDVDRNKLYISSKSSPTFNWGINSYNYNFLKKLYPSKTLRLFAPNLPSWNWGENQVFIKVLDEKNNLIALLKPLSFSKKESSLNKVQKRAFIDWRNKQMRNVGVLEGINITEKEWIKTEKIPVQTTIYENYQEMRTQPIPVWDFDKTTNNIEKSYPEFINQGVWLKDVGDLTPFNDVKKIIEKQEDIPNTISLDEFSEEVEIQSEEPIVKNQKEISIIQEDIDALQEVADGDLDILEEINELENQKQKLIDG